MEVKTMSEKNPTIALVLSILLAGLGHIYIGDTKKGLIFIVAIIIVGIALSMIGMPWIAWVISLYAAYDVYQITKN
ncbi:MAG: hypothetical protein ACRCVG_02305 [Methanobacteriaceae archaeon]